MNIYPNNVERVQHFQKLYKVRHHERREHLPKHEDFSRIRTIYRELSVSDTMNAVNIYPNPTQKLANHIKAFTSCERETTYIS